MSEYIPQFLDQSFTVDPSSVVREEEPGLTLDQHIAIIHEVLDLRSDVPWPSIGAVIDAASEVAVVVQSAKADAWRECKQAMMQWMSNGSEDSHPPVNPYRVSVQKQEDGK